jgi:GTP cyclohydrolase III
VLETWELYGCYLQSANYQELNYETNGVVTIQLSIRFDNALQTPKGIGIGTDIGRTIGQNITL